MNNIFKSIIVCFFLLIVLPLFTLGCDSTKTLNWNKTASDQSLEVGDRIKVDAAVYGLPIYTTKSITPGKWIWIKQKWETQLGLSVYNPDDPTYQATLTPFNVHAPIGVVVCTIFNPSHNDDLNQLRNMYPDTAKQDDYPSMQHRIEVVGRISSFQRQTIPSLNESEADISLSAVRLNVEELKIKF